MTLSEVKEEEGYANLTEMYKQFPAAPPVPLPAVAPSQDREGETEEEAVYERILGDGDQ